MSNDRLNYHHRKFEDEVLAKKTGAKVRILDNQGVQDIIEQLCDPKKELFSELTVRLNILRFSRP